MHRIAASLFFTAALATGPSAYAQSTTNNTTFTAIDPVYQLPVTVAVAVSTPLLFSCAAVGCQPNQIDYAVAAGGVLFDAQSRIKKPSSATFDPQVHFEKISSTVPTTPGYFLKTTIYRLTQTFPDNSQTRLEIRCQQASTLFKSYAPQGVSITYALVGVTSVSHPITAQSCPPM